MNDNPSENSSDRLTLMRKGDLKEKRKEVFSLPHQEALDKILSIQNPLPLVHSFPEEDLYFLLHEIGVEDSLPILALASSKQLEYILDREIWNKDRMDLNALAQWMDFMLEADSHRFTNWLMYEKEELLEYFLHHSIEVRLREHDEDPSDFGNAFSTFDDVLYYRILDGDPKTPEPDSTEGEDSDENNLVKGTYERVERVVREMAFENHDIYQKIMVQSVWIISPEAEEEAFRWRNVRLSEKGFPPLEEALEIYAPLSFDQLERIRKTTKKSMRKADPRVGFSESPFQLIQKDSLLPGALDLLFGTGDMDLIQQEFASLCNRIAAADQSVVKTREDLTAIVKKACGYIQIGLEKLGDIQSRAGNPAPLIHDYPVSGVFRMGFGCAMALKWRVQKWMDQSWFKSKGFTLRFWDESWMGVLGGLLIKKPLFFDPFKAGSLYREFGSLEEIQRMENIVDDIVSMDQLLSLWDFTFDSGPAPGELTHKNLILTSWAKERLGLSDEFSPLSLGDFKTFFKGIWTQKARPRKISQSAKKDFLNFMAGKTGLREDEISLKIGPVLEDIFKEIEEELGGVTLNNLDPRYIRHFLLKSP